MAVSRRRFPTSQALWEKHCRLVLDVLHLALTHLALTPLRDGVALPLGEDLLNEMLYLKAEEAYWNLPEGNRPVFFSLSLTSQNSSTDSEDVGSPWIKKRPDLKWRVQDNTAELVLDFDIECKRLGERSSGGLATTHQYVTKGLVRFLSEEHRYGDGVSQGAMIGYVQNLTPKFIAKVINACSRAVSEHKVPRIRFSGEGWDSTTVMSTVQKLTRTHVKPSNFALHHLWVDLRRA